MKKAGLILMCLMMAAGWAFGQDEDSKKERKRTKDEFRIELGLNNFLQNGQFPDQTNELYTLKPAGSRYVSLGKMYLSHLGGPLYVEWGGSVSWYNFRFQDPSVRINHTETGTEFYQETAPEVTPIKSKLTVSYVNAEIVPVVKFGSNRNKMRVGAGVYGGYRLGSYAKINYETNNLEVKDKERNTFYTDNIRYGVRGRFGFKDIDLFVNYDLNNLFIADKGPELNAISIGFVLSDMF